jgi:hypothetical protein
LRHAVDIEGTSICRQFSEKCGAAHEKTRREAGLQCDMASDRRDRAAGRCHEKHCGRRALVSYELGWSVLGHITFSCVDQQFAFQEFGHFHDGVIVFAGRFPEFAGIDRYAGVNIVMKGQDMPFVQKIPHQGIKIIGLLSKFNVKIVRKNVGDFIEAL